MKDQSPQATKQPPGASTSAGTSAVKPLTAGTTLHITRPKDVSLCPFWVGFYKSGKKTANDALKGLNTADRLTQAAIKGFLEDKPLVLTEAGVSACQSQLFVPAKSFKNSEQDMADVIKMVAGWQPEDLGVYVAPEIFNRPKCHEILRNLVGHLIEAKVVADIYLFTGSHGLNELLSVATKVKMAADSGVEIFH